MPGKMAKLDRLQDALFAGKDNLSDQEQAMLLRCQSVFAIWIDNPMMSEQELARYLIENYEVSKSVAYDDLAAVKYLLGNVTNASKEWHRYKLIAMIDKAWSIAVKAEDVKGMAALIDKLGKYTLLDQPDEKAIPWNEIIPQPFAPTDDPSVLGITPVPNIREKVKKLKEKYLGAEDVDYEPVGE